MIPQTQTVECGFCHYVRQVAKTLELSAETKSQFICPCRVRPRVQKRRLLNSEWQKFDTDVVDITAYWRVCEFCHRYAKWLHPGQKFECACRKLGPKVVRVNWGRFGRPLEPTVKMNLTPYEVSQLSKETV